MFVFSGSFVSRVQNHFGDQISPRLQEALDDGDHAQVLTLLRGSNPWPRRDDPINAILGIKNHMDLLAVKKIAFEERTLKELEARCLVELLDYADVPNRIHA